jgi:hypothetical protein
MMMTEMKGLDASDIPGRDGPEIPLGSCAMERPCHHLLENRVCPSY